MQHFEKRVAEGLPCKLAFLEGCRRTVETSTQRSNQGLTLQTDNFIAKVVARCKQERFLFPLSHYSVEALGYFFNLSLRKGLKKYRNRDFDELRSNIIEVCLGLETVLKAATARIANYSLQLFCCQTTLLTFSFSGTVLACLLNANRQGVPLRVFACETAPLYEGRNYEKALAGTGVEVHTIRDGEANSYLKKVDLVALGAQVVLQNGNILTRVGTSAVCKCAKDSNIPTYVFTEAAKFLRRFWISEDELWELRGQGGLLFQVLEEEAIQGFCTDFGISTGASVCQQMIEAISRN